MNKGVISVLLSLLTVLANAQEPSTTPTAAKPPQPQAELEKKFQEQLTNCEFIGRWSLVEGDKLGQEKEERYTIQGARKAGNELWIIQARIQYGDKDVTIPVPVQVKWAGDTPVITLTDAAIPNLGTYSARVVVYDGKYAGTWSGGNHGGLLHGIIRKKETAK
jgi:hypothetical protein